MSLCGRSFLFQTTASCISVITSLWAETAQKYGYIWNKKLFFTSLLSSLGYFWDYCKSINVSFPQIVAFIRVLDLIIHPDLNSKHHYKPPNSTETWAWVRRLCFRVLHIKRGKGVCMCVRLPGRARVWGEWCYSHSELWQVRKELMRYHLGGQREM